MAADEIGVRLEIVSGIPTWELQPGFRHQRIAFQIADSLSKNKSKGNCGWIPALDVGIKFPDGSVKRPDIAVFCREPDEQDGLVLLVPEAVIEVISPGYEAKDLEIGPTFYLSQGVRDVVVHDPRTRDTFHFRGDSKEKFKSPMTVDLHCGCSVRIPG